MDGGYGGMHHVMKTVCPLLEFVFVRFIMLEVRVTTVSVIGCIVLTWPTILSALQSVGSIFVPTPNNDDDMIQIRGEKPVTYRWPLLSQLRKDAAYCGLVEIGGETPRGEKRYKSELKAHRIHLGHKYGRHFIVLGHKYGRHFIVLGHKYGRRDVRWKPSIGTKLGILRGSKVSLGLSFLWYVQCCSCTRRSKTKI